MALNLLVIIGSNFITYKVNLFELYKVYSKVWHVWLLMYGNNHETWQ
jgi:hypothetical protein